MFVRRDDAHRAATRFDIEPEAFASATRFIANVMFEMKARFWTAFQKTFVSGETFQDLA